MSKYSEAHLLLSLLAKESKEYSSHLVKAIEPWLTNQGPLPLQSLVEALQRDGFGLNPTLLAGGSGFAGLIPELLRVPSNEALKEAFNLRASSTSAIESITRDIERMSELCQKPEVIQDLGTIA